MMYRLIYLIFGLVPSVAFASSYTINAMADRLDGHLMSVYDLIGAANYVAGFAFLIASIFKFKQHKDNPTQQTIGNPLTYLLLAVLLLYMGNIITPIGESMFGSSGGTLGRFS